MYKLYDIPFKLEKEGIHLSIEKEADVHHYRRECMDEKMEKFLLTGNSKILLNPIEPLNKTKYITPYILIEFEIPIVVEPRATRIIFIKFPVEIGVFISANANFEILDVLSLTSQKFTLYGDPRNGLICKYWKSGVYSSIPTANPIYEGIAEVNVTNATSYWVEVTKAVFNAYDMKIYYDDEMVSMKAKMKILGEEMAETDFVAQPLKEGMKKSLEIYITKKISVIGPKFMMEGGL